LVYRGAACSVFCCTARTALERVAVSLAFDVCKLWKHQLLVVSFGEVKHSFVWQQVFRLQGWHVTLNRE